MNVYVSARVFLGETNGCLCLCFSTCIFRGDSRMFVYVSAHVFLGETHGSCVYVSARVFSVTIRTSSTRRRDSICTTGRTVRCWSAAPSANKYVSLPFKIRLHWTKANANVMSRSEWKFSLLFILSSGNDKKSLSHLLSFSVNLALQDGLP